MRLAFDISRNWFAALFGLLAANMALAAPADEHLATPVRVANVVGPDINHALCVTKTGVVLAVFSTGGRSARDTLVSRSTDGGKTWSVPVHLPLFKDPTTYIYHGALTTLRDGRIVLSWSSRVAGHRVPWYAVSEDDGKTWSAAQAIALDKPSGHGTHRYPIVELSAHEWVFPLYDRTIVYDPTSGKSAPFGDGRNHGMVSIVRSSKGTLISGATGKALEFGLRSTDNGKTWKALRAFPHVGKFPYDLTALDNGWVVLTAVIYDLWPTDELSVDVGYQLIVSRDDGQTWDYDHAVEIYKPGRQIGEGRKDLRDRAGWPRTVQIDRETLGTMFYDFDKKQSGGPGLFFIRTPLTKLAPDQK
jgi:hypothetical protein